MTEMEVRAGVTNQCQPSHLEYVHLNLLLKLAEVFVVCIEHGNEEPIQRIIALGVPRTLSKLSEQHRWSSMLHSVFFHASSMASHLTDPNNRQSLRRNQIVLTHHLFFYCSHHSKIVRR